MSGSGQDTLESTTVYPAALRKCPYGANSNINEGARSAKILIHTTGFVSLSIGFWVLVVSQNVFTHPCSMYACTSSQHKIHLFQKNPPKNPPKKSAPCKFGWIFCQRKIFGRKIPPIWAKKKTLIRVGPGSFRRYSSVHEGSNTVVTKNRTVRLRKLLFRFGISLQ